MPEPKLEKLNSPELERPQLSPEKPPISVEPTDDTTDINKVPATTLELPEIEKSVDDTGPIEQDKSPDIIESIPSDLEEREKLVTEKFKSNETPKDLAKFANSLLHQEK